VIGVAQPLSNDGQPCKRILDRAFVLQDDWRDLGRVLQESGELSPVVAHEIADLAGHLGEVFEGALDVLAAVGEVLHHYCKVLIECGEVTRVRRELPK
jgi:hypothetical protein